MVRLLPLTYNDTCTRAMEALNDRTGASDEIWTVSRDRVLAAHIVGRRFLDVPRGERLDSFALAIRGDLVSRASGDGNESSLALRLCNLEPQRQRLFGG